MNYDFTLPTVYMKVDIPSYTQTGLSAFAIMQYVGTYSIKMYYLAPDPSLTYYFNSLTWNTVNIYYIFSQIVPLDLILDHLMQSII